MSRSDRERGQAAVEALLVMFLLVALTFGGIILAQGVALRHALDGGTSAAARALSLNPGGWNFAANLVQSSVDENVMGNAPAVTLQIYDANGSPRSSAWLASLSFSSTFIVEASVPFNPAIPLLAAQPITIRVRHWGVVERYP